MNRTEDSLVRRRPRWIGPTLALAALAGIALVGYGVFRSKIKAGAAAPAWEEIERGKARRGWSEMEAKLKGWIEANPAHAQARLMLADLRLGLGRRDEAVSGLSSVP